MHGKRVCLGPHFLQRSLGLAKRFAKVVQRILEPICTHTVQPNIDAAKEQFCLRSGSVLIELQLFIGGPPKPSA